MLKKVLAFITVLALFSIAAACGAEGESAEGGSAGGVIAGDIPDGVYVDRNRVASIAWSLGLGYDTITIYGNTLTVRCSATRLTSEYVMNDSELFANVEYTYEVIGNEIVITGRLNRPAIDMNNLPSVSFPFEMDGDTLIISGAEYIRQESH